MTLSVLPSLEGNEATRDANPALNFGLFLIVREGLRTRQSYTQ